MKLLALAAAAAATFAALDLAAVDSASGDLAVQDPAAEAPEPEDHEWVAQLVGEWTAEFETTLEPGAEPETMESTESVRAVGRWILAEGAADFEGTPFTSILTLGYDQNEGAFVGTWVDSIQTNMWVYRGTLDESRKVLTLETEGPSELSTDGKALYHDVIELVNPDLRTLTSSIRMPDGTWNTYLRAKYRRKR